eukprot:364201-Chlamydomonas_euryale.AAC.18
MSACSPCSGHEAAHHGLATDADRVVNVDAPRSSHERSDSWISELESTLEDARQTRGCYIPAEAGGG